MHITLYLYLKNELGGMMGGSVKWNFTKFLIDRQGNPVKRFAPVVTPKKIAEWIEAHHILDGSLDHEYKPPVKIIEQRGNAGVQG